MQRIPAVFVLLLMLILAIGAAETPMREMLDRTGIRAGLGVHIGSTDGALEAALAGAGTFAVLGLCRDPAQAQQAQAALIAAGRAGVASVEWWFDQRRLPFPDEHVNLLIADLDALGPAAPSEAEIDRVLVPGGTGAAWLRRDGTWTVRRRDMPKEYDGWEQYWHDAQGTDMSRDTAVAPPTGIAYLHSFHETSANGLRFSDGRMVHDRWATYRANPDRQELVERSAFNGLPLWIKVSTGTQAQPMPATEKFRPLVITGGRIYSLRSLVPGTPIDVVDARDGSPLPSLPGLLPVQTVVIGKNDRGKEDVQPDMGELVAEGDLLIQTMANRMVLVDRKTGMRRWEFVAGAFKTLRRPRVNVQDGEVYVIGANDGTVGALAIRNRWPSIYGASRIFALDLGTGAERWHVDRTHPIASIAYADRRLAFMSAIDNGGYPVWAAIDTGTGQLAYEFLPNHRSGDNSSKEDKGWINPLFPSQIKTLIIGRGKAYMSNDSLLVFDLQSGAQLAKNKIFNARCEQGRGTPNLICGAFGQFTDIRGIDQPEYRLRTQSVMIARGACAAGYWPAFGRLHYMGTPCNCANWLRASTGLHAEAVWQPVADERRLVRGPAHGQVAGSAAAAGDWPTYLGSGLRNGWSSCAVGTGKPLVEQWTASVAARMADESSPIAYEPRWAGFWTGRIEAPVVAGDLLVSVDREAHAVIGLDAGTGRERWRYLAGGRVITPPTLADGYCVFGGRDGWVYALRAGDGALAWRFLAARTERRHVAFGQLESPWPLWGSLPVVDGVVVAMAGHTPQTDGGLLCWGLDLRTGAVRWRKEVAYRAEWRDLRGTGPLHAVPGSGAPADHPTLRESGYGNAIKNAPPYADGGRVGGDGYVVDAADGTMLLVKDRFDTFPKDPAEPTKPMMRVVMNSVGTFLHERQGQGRNNHSANDSRPPLVWAWGVNQPQRERTPVTTDGQRYLRVGREDREFLLYMTSAGRQPARTELLAKLTKDDGLIWKTVFADIYFVSNTVSAMVGCADAVAMATQAVQYSDLPYNPQPGHVHLFSAADGHRIQDIQLPSAVMRNGIAIARDRLYLACEDGTIHCFSAPP